MFYHSVIHGLGFFICYLNVSYIIFNSLKRIKDRTAETSVPGTIKVIHNTFRTRKHSPAARVFYISLVFSNAVVFYHSVIHGLGFFICYLNVSYIRFNSFKRIKDRTAETSVPGTIKVIHNTFKTRTSNTR